MKQSPILFVGAALLLGSLTPAHAATMILHNFSEFAEGDGAFPFAAPTPSGSTLYGVTALGAGEGNAGTIFRMNTDGSGFHVLHNFIRFSGDGESPAGGLTLSGSKLYGTTSLGGSSEMGALFSINTDGTGYSLLHSFNGSGGTYPIYSLTLSGSKLYGVTGAGGSNDAGTLFSINTDGTGFAPLHDFGGADADPGFPAGSLTLSGSKLYGVTNTGGSGFRGTVFSMNTDGTGFAVLHSFQGGVADGALPGSSLTLAGTTLFGITGEGGTSGYGTLFRMNTDGTGFHLLHSFIGYPSDGASPLGSLALSGSTLYGSVQGGSGPYGALFSVGTDGAGYSLIENFGGAPDGDTPADLTVSADGSVLYGVTLQGGTANEGVVFSRAISPPVPEPGASVLLGLGAFLLSARRRNARA